MRRTIFFLVCISTLAFFSVLPATGLTQSLDQLVVLDDANIFGNRIGEVEAAANKLVSQGGDVRVRTILTYGAAGNLDQYEAELEQQSPSWLGQDDDRKSNLIVLIISLQEGQTGLYYGAYWDNVLGDEWLRIQTDIINPFLRSGDYAGGAIKGLEEIQQLIAGNEQSKSRWWLVPVVIVAIIGAIIGLVLYMSYRKKRTKQAAARQKAMLAKQAAASGINELIETTQMLEIKVNVTAEKVVSDDAALLRDGLETAKRLINQSSQTYSELSHSAGDPENPRLGEAELAAIEPEYQKILGNLRQARAAIEGVEERITAVQQTIDGFPKKVAELNAAIEGAVRKQDELKALGFASTYPAELVAKGRNALEKAQDLVSKKRIGEAMKYVSLAGDQIEQAIRAAEELPQKKLETEAAIPALLSRIEQVKEKINKGRDIFERLSQEYAESNWESIRGNGTEAENRVNWAVDALNDALAAAAMEQQEWHKALALVEKGNVWLTESESLMKSISELQANLIAERRDTPNEIAAAQSDVTKAWEYINRYDEDIRESLEDDLRTAEKKNELAREELKQAKPDYFKAGKLARESNEAADRILIQARDEHEAAERLRAKAATVRRDARAKVSIAKMYVEVHHPVVRSEARNYLINAVEALRQADASTDVNAQISLASEAEAAADQAYALAQRDVDATTRNIPNIGMPTRTTIPTILIPPQGYSPGGYPSWGSRRNSGSSSGNTIRRGGGGSSSWGSKGGMSRGGGASRRGGGSTGW
jgi:uncharacterized membrane protein YgcG